MMDELERGEMVLKQETQRLRWQSATMSKLNQEHEAWMVWRVRKELERIRALKEEGERMENMQDQRRREFNGNGAWASDNEDRDRQERTWKAERDRLREEQQVREKDRQRREQERLQREKEKEGKNVRLAWEAHVARWDELRLTKENSLTFCDIPWPMLGLARTPAHITADNIAPLLIARYDASDLSPKERLRSALLFWHPDKWEGKWLSRVQDRHRPAVREGVSAVARAINELLRRV
jgi:hypothetical protein